MESFGHSHSKPMNLNGITTIIFFILITLLSIPLCTSSARIQSIDENKPKKTSSNKEFIKTSCGATLYPSLCYESLSPYSDSISADPARLANAALDVSLKAAKAASEKVSELAKGQNGFGPREARTVLDCVENMEDSVDELQRSVGLDFGDKIEDVMTWVSAALTDEGTCMDEFQENGMNGVIKVKVRDSIVNVAQLTSNALALIKNLSP